MDSTADQRFTRTEVRLDEPHFDEEATLLSAQPVVPLDEVKAKTRSKARLALASAIVGGLLIGLLTATLIYRYAGSNDPGVLETTSVTEQPEEDQQNSAGGTTVEPEETAVVATKEEKTPIAAPEEPVDARPEPASAKPEPAALNAPESRPVIAADSSERADDQDVDLEIRRSERREERRERRRAAREARREPRERAQTTDDLLRIREIFEGTPRP
jgi:hypothetical protein